MLDDSAATFVFLHMPVPHPGGIYDRLHKMLTIRASSYTSSYIDNLALADIYLAHVRDLLQQRGDWDSSTIVILGDHSWRTSFLWSKSDWWTAEDQAASHGAEYDRRAAPSLYREASRATAGVADRCALQGGPHAIFA